MNIILVEDRSDQSETLRMMLGLRCPGHFEMVICSTLKETIDMATSLHPDAILLDLNLPDSTGAETVTRFRAACPDVPVIVLTCLDAKTYEDPCRQAGAVAFLDKIKVEPWDLVAVIERSAKKEEAKEPAPELEFVSTMLHLEALQQRLEQAKSDVQAAEEKK